MPSADDAGPAVDGLLSHSIQRHQPRLAELVAEAIRGRILSGALHDGDFLPNQDRLLDEFRVSKPSLREALRILEAEGIITVRRGNVGGAVVHLPKAEHAAYTLALVLQSRGVAVGDVVQAVKQLNALCAGLCAAREDRHAEVMPALAACNEKARSVIDDELVFVGAMAEFHNSIIAYSGNETLILVAGALESLWAAHLRRWAEQFVHTDEFPDRSHREHALQMHERIAALIENGDRAAVVEVARDHFEPWTYYGDPSKPVLASPLRDDPTRSL